MGNSVFIKERLHSAIERADSNMVDSILDKMPLLLNEQLTFDSKETPLIQAVRCRNRQLVERLIERGADINKANDRGLTPLMMTCIRDCADIVALLLTLPVLEYERQSIDGLSALDYSVLYGHFHLAKLLRTIYQQELKSPTFYYAIGNKHSIRYVNYDIILLHLQKELDDEALPDFLSPPRARLVDPVIDPRETWKAYFSRLGAFQKPPLVERKNLPEELRPENRCWLSCIRTASEFGGSQTKKKEYCAGMQQATQVQLQLHAPDLTQCL